MLTLCRYFDKQWANYNATFLTPRQAAPPTPSNGKGQGSGSNRLVPDQGRGRVQGRVQGQGQGREHATFGLWNQTDRLFMRDDTHLWSDGYWGRGNGWAMLGLVDAVRYGSMDYGGLDPHHARYVDVFKRFASRLVELQGADGAWRSSMLDTVRFPTPETTGTACFTRGLAFGLNAGLLDEDTFAPAVRKAWGYLAHTALQPTGQVGFCQGPGGGPGNGFNASSTSDFCVGMFLGAAAEVALLR